MKRPPCQTCAGVDYMNYPEIKIKEAQARILRSIAFVVGTFWLIAIVSCGTYIGNMSSIRTQQAEIAAQAANDEARWKAFSDQLRSPTATPTPGGVLL